MPSPSSVNIILPPVHGYRGETPTPAPVAKPRGLVVAISREAGARGATVAKKVGELLGWQVFDPETIDYLVQNDTAREQFLTEIPESARAWAASHLALLRRKGKVGTSADAATMVELLLAVGARGDAVILGRGAGFVLPVETTVHVRIVAPLDARVQYFAQELRMTREEATAEVRSRDEQRANFLRETLGRDATEATAYDVVINVQRLGIEGTAQFIGWAVRTKQMFAEIRDAAGEPEDVPTA